MYTQSVTPRERLDRLLALDSPEFLGQAYLAMLGRPIDTDGFQTYNRKLLAGISRLEILCELRASQEGRAFGASAPNPLVLVGEQVSVSPVIRLSLHDLLLRDGSNFVNCAFATISGRQPTNSARSKHLSDLYEGVDKLQVLLEITDSPGGAQQGSNSAELRREIESMRGSLYPVARNLAELAKLEDIAFVDCAYKTLLQRAPDAMGAANYLQLVRSGESKILVLSKMYFSLERRQKSTVLPGLKQAIVRYWLACNPLVGWCFRAIARAEGDTPMERRMRIVESALLRLTRESERRSCEMDFSVDDVARLFAAVSNRRFK
jgi:hypothetical protein